MRMIKPIHNFLNFFSIKNIIVIFLFLGFLSSCSLPNLSSIPSIPSVPNWVKPSNALKKVTGVFSRYRSERSKGQENKKISLEDVPERPKSSIFSKRNETISGLKSDSKNARYLDEADKSESKVTIKEKNQAISENKVAQNKINKRKVSNDEKSKSSDNSLNSRRIITSGKSKSAGSINDQSNKRIIQPENPKIIVADSKVQLKEKIKGEKKLALKSERTLLKVDTSAKRESSNKIDDMIAKGSNKVDQNIVQATFSKLINQSNSKVSNVPIGRDFQSTKAKKIMPGETIAKPVLRDLYNSSIIIDSSSDNPENIKKIQSSELVLSSFTNSENLEPILTINFAHDSKNLSYNDKLKLKKLVEEYGSKLGTVIVIGHASSRTRDMNVVNHQLVNFKISVDRAQSVANELIDLSISPLLIKIEARGSSEPKYFESMPSGEAANRRTEIFIIESSS